MSMALREKLPVDKNPPSDLPREFLTFKLGGEEYGVDILAVQEIRSYSTPTRMVQAPNSILGVINLRGVMVPIIDMRLRIGLTKCSFDKFTVTIVLNIRGRVIGLVVDSVSDVTNLSQEQLRPVPDISSPISQHLLAIGSIGDRMLLLLDADDFMNFPETNSSCIHPEFLNQSSGA